MKRDDFGRDLGGVEAGDFVEVRPGESFDPYATGKIGYNLATETFQKAGRYTATFRYMTNATSSGLWASQPCESCELGNDVRALLERVPLLDLIAVTTFDVAP